MEARRDERAALVRAEEAAKSESAEERRESGRRPSFVAAREEEKRVREDLRKGTGCGIEEMGGIVIGGMTGESGTSGDIGDVGLRGIFSTVEGEFVDGIGNKSFGICIVGDDCPFGIVGDV